MKRGRVDSAAARLAISDELGLLKVVEVPRGHNWASSHVVQTWGQPDKSAAIHVLAAPNYLLTDTNILAASRLGGSIQVLDALAGQSLCTLPPHKPSTPAAASSNPSSSSQKQQSTLEREVKCLAFRQEPSSSTSAPLELVSSTVGGTVRLHRQWQGEEQQEAGEAGVQGMGTSGCVQTWDEVAAFQAGPNVGCMALDPSQSHIAVGGDGCHLRVWSLNQQQEVFRAKGGKPSRSGLVDLPHLTAATFLPDPSNQLVVVGTVKHKLWMYDLRVGKRPQVDMEWGDARVTALAADPNGQCVWAANGLGRIEGIDLRARVMRGCLKGPAGSIRSLALHPRSPSALAPSSSPPGSEDGLPDSSLLIASAGLDRFLRVHSMNAGQQALSKVYLKQQLTGVVWLRPPAESPAGDEEEQQHADEGQKQDVMDAHMAGKGGEKLPRMQKKKDNKGDIRTKKEGGEGKGRKGKKQKQQ